ncbi:cytochrome c [Crocinitomicaceae bacterium]|nr:cytochrome c [Crocinitomicaceae bacterium]
MNYFKTIFFLTAAIIISGCFRENSGTRRDKTEKGEGRCGVVDNRDLTEMSRSKAPSVFKAKCATCHHYAKNATGPPLKGFMQRAHSEEWFRKFIRNQDDLIEEGDSLAIAIQEQRPTKGMHYHNLSDKELDDLIEYLQ